MKKQKPEFTYSVTTDSVYTKRAPFLGLDHPGTRYVVWSPDSTRGVREYGNFHKARRVAHSLSEKHPDRCYRVFKTCWGRSADQAALKKVPESIKATAVELA